MCRSRHVIIKGFNRAKRKIAVVWLDFHLCTLLLGNIKIERCGDEKGGVAFKARLYDIAQIPPKDSERKREVKIIESHLKIQNRYYNS